MPIPPLTSILPLVSDDTRTVLMTVVFGLVLLGLIGAVLREIPRLRSGRPFEPGEAEEIAAALRPLRLERILLFVVTLLAFAFRSVDAMLLASALAVWVLLRSARALSRQGLASSRRLGNLGLSFSVFVLGFFSLPLPDPFVGIALASYAAALLVLQRIAGCGHFQKFPSLRPGGPDAHHAAAQRRLGRTLPPIALAYGLYLIAWKPGLVLDDEALLEAASGTEAASSLALHRAAERGLLHSDSSIDGRIDHDASMILTIDRLGLEDRFPHAPWFGESPAEEAPRLAQLARRSEGWTRLRPPSLEQLALSLSRHSVDPDTRDAIVRCLVAEASDDTVGHGSLRPFVKMLALLDHLEATTEIESLRSVAHRRLEDRWRAPTLFRPARLGGSSEVSYTAALVVRRFGLPESIPIDDLRRSLLFQLYDSPFSRYDELEARLALDVLDRDVQPRSPLERVWDWRLVIASAAYSALLLLLVGRAPREPRVEEGAAEDGGRRDPAREARSPELPAAS